MTELMLIPIIPEIFLAVMAMMLLIFGAFKKECKNKENSNLHMSSNFMFKAASLVIILTGVLLYQLSTNMPEIILNRMFILDEFAVFAKILILISAFFIMIMSKDYYANKVIITNYKVPFEYPILILLAVVGMMIMVSANDLISLYMGLELQSLALYVLVSINRKSELSSEAGLKYFMLGAFSSGILLYGCSLIYGFTGTTNFSDFSSLTIGENGAVEGVLIGGIFIIIGICFKVSAAPFHMWTPDVYEGASKPITALLATASKVAAIAFFIRFTTQQLPLGDMNWQHILIFVSAASMIIGSFAALKQVNIKRLMAYSSIGHMGFILVGLAAGNQEGVHAVLIYSAIYVVMNIGAFSAIILMRSSANDLSSIRDLSGLSRNRPVFAALIGVLMLSMAGIPPLAGFFGKLFVFKAALQAELYTLVIIAVLCSVVSAFYYLRIIKIMYFDNVAEPLPQYQISGEMSLEIKFVLLIAGLFNVGFFLYATPLLDAAKSAAKVLF